MLSGCYPDRVGGLGVLFPNSKVALNPEGNGKSVRYEWHLIGVSLTLPGFCDRCEASASSLGNQMGQETKWVKPLFDKQRGLTQ